MQVLKGKVAVVAGATRGAGRGIACMLGAAGATVYCTGRSVRGRLSAIGRPETIEETAEMVSAHGGTGLWAQVDHTQPDRVRALFERVRREQHGRLDILVNNISGNFSLGDDGVPFWEHSLERGLESQRAAIHAHIITSHYAVPLMLAHRRGLIVEINDGNGLGYNVNLYYSLNKNSAILLAYFMSVELRQHNIAAVALTPGYLRSEVMLEHKGVTEETWQDGIGEDEAWVDSETPFYVGRAVVALAADSNVMQKTGRALSAGWLARDYGFTDVDGRQPPGYYPKEGIFDPLRRGFALHAQGLSAVECLLGHELKSLAEELGITEAQRMSFAEVLAAVKSVDPKRVERKVSGRFVR